MLKKEHETNTPVIAIDDILLIALPTSNVKGLWCSV